MYGSDNLIKAYIDCFPVRLLAQIIPYGSGIDFTLNTVYNNLLNKRKETFFRNLESGEINLSQEVIESEEFVHNFLITYNAVLRTNRDEKIKLFADILKNYFRPDSDPIPDEYDEIIQIIDDISYREFLIVFKIHQQEILKPISRSSANIEGDKYNRATEFWPVIKEYMINDLNIPENEHESILKRLTRTGLYITFYGFSEDIKGKGFTSNLFEKIFDLLKTMEQ